MNNHIGCALISFLAFLITFRPLLSSREDEEEWIRLYGTHKNDSGKWPFARYLRTEEPKLQSFCIRAHKQWNKTQPKAVDAHVSFWLVTFDDRTIEPIWADMIQYAIDGQISSTEVAPYYWAVKGNRPDCVFYLREYKQHADKFNEMVFADHVCGIDLQGFENWEAEFAKTMKPERKKKSKS